MPSRLQQAFYHPVRPSQGKRWRAALASVTTWLHQWWGQGAGHLRARGLSSTPLQPEDAIVFAAVGVHGTAALRVTLCICVPCSVLPVHLASWQGDV